MTTLNSAVLSNQNRTLTLEFDTDPGEVAFADLGFSVVVGTIFIAGTGTERVITILNAANIDNNIDVTHDGTTVTTTGHAPVFPIINVRMEDGNLIFNPPEAAGGFRTLLINQVNVNSSDYDAIRFRDPVSGEYIAGFTADYGRNGIWDGGRNPITIDNATGEYSWDVDVRPWGRPASDGTNRHNGTGDWDAGFDFDLAEAFVDNERRNLVIDRTFQNRPARNSTAGGMFFGDGFALAFAEENVEDAVYSEDTTTGNPSGLLTVTISTPVAVGDLANNIRFVTGVDADGNEITVDLGTPTTDDGVTFVFEVPDTTAEIVEVYLGSNTDFAAPRDWTEPNPEDEAGEWGPWEEVSRVVGEFSHSQDLNLEDRHTGGTHAMANGGWEVYHFPRAEQDENPFTVNQTRTAMYLDFYHDTVITEERTREVTVRGRDDGLETTQTRNVTERTPERDRTVQESRTVTVGEWTDWHPFTGPADEPTVHQIRSRLITYSEDGLVVRIAANREVPNPFYADPDDGIPQNIRFRIHTLDLGAGYSNRYYLLPIGAEIPTTLEEASDSDAVSATAAGYSGSPESGLYVAIQAFFTQGHVEEFEPVVFEHDGRYYRVNDTLDFLAQFGGQWGQGLWTENVELNSAGGVTATWYISNHDLSRIIQIPNEA